MTKLSISHAHFSGVRGSLDHHVMVRLAYEGVPIAAIARGFKVPSSDIVPILREAVEAGHIVKLPAYDWKFEEVRASAGNARSQLPADNIENHTAALSHVFGLTPLESMTLAILFKRRVVTKEALFVSVYPGIDRPEIRIIDGFICKIRKKLAPFQIGVQTNWGRGYSLTPDAAIQIKRRCDAWLALQFGDDPPKVPQP